MDENEGELEVLAAELADRREPFVRVTVVRAQAPTSARAGDRGLVCRDGTIAGFVGGQCAAGSIRTAAHQVIESGEPLLLRVLPEGAVGFPESAGATLAVNPCLSGGAMEVFLEPVLPAPICHVAGQTPIARAVVEQARLLGFEVRQAEDGHAPAGALAAVVALHGSQEPEALLAALGAGVPWIGLVASAKRGVALLDELDLPAHQRERVHTPAGLHLGARTPQEVALSILAEVVRARRLEGLAVPESAPAAAGDHETTSAHAATGGEATTGGHGTTPAERPAPPPPPLPVELTHRRPDESPPGATRPQLAQDPVCGMSVVVRDGIPHAVVDGVDVWFCCTGCRDRYVAEHSTGH